MIYTLFQTGFNNPLREKRLMYNAIGGTPNEGPTYSTVAARLLDYPDHQDFLTWVQDRPGRMVEGVTWMTGSVAAWLAKEIIQIPAGLLRGIKAVWEQETNNEEMLSLIGQTAAFFRDVPTLGDDLGRFIELKALDKQQMFNMVSHELWVDAFATENIFDEPQTPVDPANTGVKPADFLLSLDPEERKKVYFEYVDTFIPTNLQGDAKPIVKDEDASRRFIRLKNEQKDTFNGALGAILGIDKWQNLKGNVNANESKTLAEKSLTQHYRTNKSDFARMSNNGLVNDLNDAKQFAKFGGHTFDLDNPKEIARYMAPSRLKGMLTQNVLSKENFRKLAGGIQEIEYLERLAIGKTEQNLSVLTKATKQSLKKEANTLMDTWNNLNGVETVLLCAGLAYLLYKSDTAKTVGLGLAGAYFVQKFGFRQDDPIAVWSSFLNSSVDAGSELGKSAIGDPASLKGTSELRHRAEIYVNLLSPHDRDHMDKESVALALMHEIELPLLAEAFVMNGQEGHKWEMNIKPGSPLDLQLAEVMAKRGWSKDYRTYFKDPKNVKYLTQAMGLVFYKIAKDSHDGTDKDVAAVENVWNKMPAGAGLPYLPSPFTTVNYKPYNMMNEDPDLHLEMLTAQQIYMRLVAQGRGIAGTMGNETLGHYVYHNMLTHQKDQEMRNRYKTPYQTNRAGGAAPTTPNAGNQAPGIPQAGNNAPSNTPGAGNQAPGNPNPAKNQVPGNPNPGNQPQGNPNPAKNQAPGNPNPGNQPQGNPNPGNQASVGPGPGNQPQGNPDPAKNQAPGNPGPAKAPPAK
ncbi:hypothetical protein K8942_02260 [Candidatus Peribacteria bacterium]|nr:MAG: hypothetical protein K8942_02260 [Candidatus Peribacteria bacterium]